VTLNHPDGSHKMSTLASVSHVEQQHRHLILCPLAQLG